MFNNNNNKVGFKHYLKGNKIKDNINMLLYYFGICLYICKCDPVYIKLVNSVSEIYAVFSSKKEGVSYKKLFEVFNKKIELILNQFGNSAKFS